jgi:hypothetical protein
MLTVITLLLWGLGDMDVPGWVWVAVVFYDVVNDNAKGRK